MSGPDSDITFVVGFLRSHGFHPTESRGREPTYVPMPVFRDELVARAIVLRNVLRDAGVELSPAGHKTKPYIRASYDPSRMAKDGTIELRNLTDDTLRTYIENSTISEEES